MLFCPGCGAPRLTRHGAKRFACPDCGFIYFHNVAAAVAGILEVDGRILLATRAEEPQRGWYDLPGGFVDPAESAETALCREIREELNLELLEARYFGSYPNRYRFAGISYRTLDLVYACRVAGLDGLRAADDVAACQLFEPAALPLERIAFPSVRRALADYLTQRR